MSAPVARLIIGFGSESGNARLLAQRLGADTALQAWAPQVLPLNEVSLAALGSTDALLIVSSSFGDGEPPGNAEAFLAEATAATSLAGLRYAIFGLGDTAYPRFCGFTKGLDAVLAARGAEALLQRVDADAHYAGFFARWVPVLVQVLQGDAQAGRELCLQVKAYDESAAFAAPILERHQLNQGEPGAWHIRLDITGSGMVYRAGDNLYVLPGNDSALLQALADWYGAPQAADLLATRELRQLSKPVLRELAKLSGNDTLKGMLKMSQRQALETYLWGADLLDVLTDFCSPESVPLDALAALLPACLPRAYSIASAGGDTVDLCVREVVYTREGRARRGCATQWLLQHDGPVRVFCRANPGFHLPEDPAVPIILAGTGTGIAPLIGLLRELQASGQQRDTCLVFGERHHEHDFLYREELQAMREQGTLAELLTAFSRQGPEKYYVQHAMAEHGTGLGERLARGAHVYLCGNKRHLEPAVAEAIETILAGSPPPEDERGVAWQALADAGRLHRELY